MACASVASLPALFGEASEPLCGEPAGHFNGLTISGEKRVEADVRELTVQRSGSASAGRDGMPLCFGDLIITGLRVTVNIKMHAEPNHDLTLYPNTTTELVDQSSIFLRLGRLFLSLRGRFDIQTTFARLGARGTQLEVGVTRDGLDVVQLEGTVDVTAQPSRVPALLLLDNAPSHSGPFVATSNSEAPAQAFRLDRLTRVTLARGTQPRLLAVDETLVRRLVDENSTTIAAMHPSLPSQNLDNVFDSIAKRNAAYQEARFQTIWAPERGEFFRLLGDVHTEWAEGDKASRAYEQAGGAVATGRTLALAYDRLGNARRLAGDLDAAEQFFRQAMAADPQFAFPYNGLGDVYRDRTVAARDRGTRLPAYDFALRARDLYERSLDRSLSGKDGGPNRAVALVNLGQILLHLGDINAGEPGGAGVATARQLYADADRRFQEALTESRESPFALVGRGNVLAAQAQLYEAERQPELARQALGGAQAQLEGVVKRFPDFAVAHQWLGVVYERSGQPERAVQLHLRATELDPQYATAYFRLAETLTKVGRQDQARPYYGTYLHVETPAFRNGSRMATAASAVGTRPGAEPQPPSTLPRLKVPQLIGKSRSQAEDMIRKAGFTVGSITVKQSRERRDTVIAQSLEPESLSAKGSSISVTVAGPEPKRVRVPDLIGDDRESAVKEIKDKRFTVGDIREQTSCEAAGKVLTQDPSKDAELPERSTIALVVSSLGSRPARVPDLKGRTPGDAERMLRDAGLTIGNVRSEENNSIKRSAVVGQDPKAGARLARDCSVTLTVAVPAARVRVPSFIKMTIDQARQQLAGSGSDFRLGTVTYRASEDRPGTVVAQDPLGGTTVPRGSGTQVHLVVASPSGGQDAPTGGGGRGGGGGGGRGGRGDGLVEVPPIIGRSVTEAVDMLRKVGLGCYVPPNESGNVVADSQPRPGERTKPGSRVQLKLRRGELLERSSVAAPSQAPSPQRLCGG
jgi:beta-lactam-binding protein with PASTA domain/tetratricopeptide (TPR) repeat protein